jgi:hypothetical protein
MGQSTRSQNHAESSAIASQRAARETTPDQDATDDEELQSRRAADGSQRIEVPRTQDITATQRVRSAMTRREAISHVVSVLI